ncbi:hypothetical protein [Burkholderia cenocepacia]|uniref:hypothetical protein n=1 Tax=Burkholderia cenocepacia TaxID=95486 RepID=UPI0021AB5DC1|nr:hypothetical protein [Burkholderia cenocepacia]
MAAYYNEIDPYAAQWLRNLIAAGHIALGDVDERSIEDGEGIEEATQRIAVILSRFPAQAAELVAIPAGCALVPIQRSYDMRTMALIAFNTMEQAGNDQDDALDAAHRATIEAAPRPPGQADAREELTVDQQRTVECADAWLSDKGLPTYSELRTLLALYPDRSKQRAEVHR